MKNGKVVSEVLLDMNKIVLDHYPLERLPADIQDKMPEAQEVRLTIEKIDQPGEKPVSLEDIFADRQPRFRSADDIMASIYEGRYEDR